MPPSIPPPPQNKKTDKDELRETLSMIPSPKNNDRNNMVEPLKEEDYKGNDLDFTHMSYLSDEA